MRPVALGVAWASIAIAALACGARSEVELLGGGAATASGDVGGTGGVGGAGGAALIACPSCRMLGWSCPGPGLDACCDGLPCLETPHEGGTAWFCGGVSASGQDEPCLGEGSTCRWEEPTACPERGPIAGFCSGDAQVAQLRRCDGTCFVPNELYQTFFVRGCEAVDAGVVCPQERCAPIWDAVLCCDD